MVAHLEKTVLEDPEVERHTNRFFRTFNRIGKRLRSLSPSKYKGKKKVI
jgi:hypothetical protein